MSSNPDPEHLEFTRAQRLRQRRLALVMGAVVLVPLAWLIVHEVQAASARRAARLSTAQKTELAALLDQREAVARERVEHWNAAIQRDALAAFTPGTDACPLTLTPPSQASAAEYVKYATHSPAFGAWSLCILRAADDATTCTRTLAVDPTRIALRARSSEDDVYVWDLEQERAAATEEAPAVLVIVGAEVRPTVHSPAVGRVSFAPGTLSGRSYLYAPEQGHFICAGDVSARNSKNVDIEVSHFGETPSAQQNTAEHETRLALERDLELHLRFATPPALRKLAAP